jgi:Nucleotidyltransferase domain
MNEWHGRDVAARLRQWPQIADLADRVDSSPWLAGLFLLGSFARGEADSLSDVDFMVVVESGRFAEAWERRHDLHCHGATCWDYPRPDEREVAAHRWLTDDLVLFDGLISTTSGARIDDPLVVLVGEPNLPGRFARRERPAAGGESIEPHEVERLYGQLKLAARDHRRQE